MPSARSDLPAEDLLRTGLLRSQIVLWLGSGCPGSEDGSPGSGPGPRGPGSAGPQGSGPEVDLSVPDLTRINPGVRSPS